MGLVHIWIVLEFRPAVAGQEDIVVIGGLIVAARWLEIGIVVSPVGFDIVLQARRTSARGHRREPSLTLSSHVHRALCELE
ncbi:hypothetical protein BD626DRAFT_523539 [Schizophyllum amplum]|uniref:Secreted protein n=1 Tax=Schizophyllum amplum TaxID=97359 RepID=A0A550BSY8_9AGAR|nr:hypothetical protein BD626DRAFT_523539 [Auriculariopsis ampla]